MQGPSESDEEWLEQSFDSYSMNRDPELRDQIAEQTLWLATRGARRFADRGEPFDDLVQVARIGLLNAIDRFDPAHGVPFGAYATPTIMGELRRYFRDHTWGVHVSRRAKDLRPAVNAASETLSRELRRSPRVSEIAARMKIPEESVIEALEANNAYRARTLDHSGKALPAIENNLEEVLNREVITGLLDRLSPRQRQILHLRFFDELSQAQIAEKIGTSQVHVGRLIASSLVELRGHLREDSPGSG
ncbi:MAG: polymerase sigma-B factor [Ilumatobacteraceae bacterium]|jgi:RNA polymerase sigma-B factor